jgi:hypothetical protein
MKGTTNLAGCAAQISQRAAGRYPERGFDRVVRRYRSRELPMIEKKNRMQDQMLDKKDETTGEIRGRGRIYSIIKK